MADILYEIMELLNVKELIKSEKEAEEFVRKVNEQGKFTLDWRMSKDDSGKEHYWFVKKEENNERKS